MDFQDQEEVVNEDYPFISMQQSTMLEGTAKFQDAYVLLRLYDETYEHYMDKYANGNEDDITMGEARQFATFMINKLFPARG